MQNLRSPRRRRSTARRLPLAVEHAREAYERIKDLLGREVLDQRFDGMKEALEGATEGTGAVSKMLDDLNQLLDKHRRGEDIDADFQEFMAKHGQYFPENPQSVEELIDALAQRAPPPSGSCSPCPPSSARS